MVEWVHATLGEGGASYFTTAVFCEHADSSSFALAFSQITVSRTQGARWSCESSSFWSLR